MTREQLNKANDLVNDLNNIEKVLICLDNDRFASVICATDREMLYSKRFQKSLEKWLKAKKEEYEIELENL